MTRVRIVGDDECHHGVSWLDWCEACACEDGATCLDCDNPIGAACVCLPDSDEPTSHLDRQQEQAESIAVHRRDRGMEIVRDPLKRIA
jgi:hypothetical protein